jgi:hypothetical protein
MIACDIETDIDEAIDIGVVIVNVKEREKGDSYGWWELHQNLKF